MSVPVVVGQTGIEKIIQCRFTASELQQLATSAGHIRRLIDQST